MESSDNEGAQGFDFDSVSREECRYILKLKDPLFTTYSTKIDDDAKNLRAWIRDHVELLQNTVRNNVIVF